MARDPRELTARQQQILDFIRKAIKAKGVPPSIREIGEAVSLRSSSTVHRQLKALEKAGFLARDPALSRSIKVRQKEAVKGKPEDPALPLVRALRDAEPLLDEDNVEKRLAVPFSFEPDAAIFLTVLQGETLRDMGILPGDLLAVRAQSAAEPGDLVVALVDGASTVMRCYPAAGAVRLEPENRRMRPIFVRAAVIVGKVVAVFRKL